MNILFRMEKGIAVCLFSSFFVLACVNHLSFASSFIPFSSLDIAF